MMWCGTGSDFPCHQFVFSSSRLRFALSPVRLARKRGGLICPVPNCLICPVPNSGNSNSGNSGWGAEPRKNECGRRAQRTDSER